MARAASSFPVPDSPRIRTVAEDLAYLRMRSTAARKGGDAPTKFKQAKSSIHASELLNRRDQLACVMPMFLWRCHRMLVGQYHRSTGECGLCKLVGIGFKIYTECFPDDRYR